MVSFPAGAACHPVFGAIPMFAIGFGPLGVWELLVILFIVLLLFGSRLPSVMRSMGQGVVEFKKGLNQPTDEDSKDAAPPA
jgi:sec-independent protein translocase protein TatA